MKTEGFMTKVGKKVARKRYDVKYELEKSWTFHAELKTDMAQVFLKWKLL